MTFDGYTYDHARDHKRLTTEFNAVKTILLDGEWHTLPELFARTGYPVTSALTSRIRDLRRRSSASTTSSHAASVAVSGNTASSCRSHNSWCSYEASHCPGQCRC